MLSFVNDLIPSQVQNPRDAAILKFQKRLKVQAVEHSSVITLAYQGASIDLSSKVLAAVLGSARKAHLRINRIDGSDAFFAEQSANGSRRSIASKRRCAASRTPPAYPTFPGSGRFS